MSSSVKTRGDATDYAAVAEMARRVRINCVRMTNKANASHIGSSLSVVDVLASLYHGILRYDPQNPEVPERDKLILSKGHGCAALYSVLAEVGYFPVEWLDTYYADGTRLPGHATHKHVPGVEVSTGSLGHGLPLSAGMAMGAQRMGRDSRVFCIVSDGECDEGSTWEAALFAAHHKLDNLTVVVDYNKIQSFGRVEDVLKLDPLADKWRAFGWATRELNGHDIPALCNAFTEIPFESGRPSCIVAHTIKGKGISFMEDKLQWHYTAPKGEELERALAELGASL